MIAPHTAVFRLRAALLLVTITFTLSLTSKAQTVFTYGKHAVSRDEFLNAYNKNNTDTAGVRISYQDYLELYTKFKLKVQAALDEKLDSSSEQRAEVQAFREQLAENYMKEEASIRLLTTEAADRLQKDIHITDIFIPVPRDATEQQAVDAEKEIHRIADMLQKSSTKTAERELGWITAFVLPYEIETAIYKLTPGSYTAPIRSNQGYHIFHNLEERKALGEVRVAQILLAFPPDADELAKVRLGVRADSMYKAIGAGADFGQLAAKFSDDNITYQAKGELQPFGVGKFDPVFEYAAFELKNPGDVSKPFQTGFGFHILKKIENIPPASDLEAIRQRVLMSDRMQVAQAVFVDNVKEKIKKVATPQDLSNDTNILNYYRNHLENYNSEFAEQLNEFRQGNLLFAVMQKKVWDAAATDSAALYNYFQKNRNKYFWENSADALIITVAGDTSAEALQAVVRTKAKDWRTWTAGAAGTVQADSGRFDLGQIPVVGRTNFTDGLVTAPVKNEQDGSQTLAYIIKVYRDRQPKRFEDARGSVINDYQAYLEEQWIASLKKKYPVRVNKKVFSELQSAEQGILMTQGNL